MSKKYLFIFLSLFTLPPHLVFGSESSSHKQRRNETRKKEEGLSVRADLKKDWKTIKKITDPKNYIDEREKRNQKLRIDETKLVTYHNNNLLHYEEYETAVEITTFALKMMEKNYGNRTQSYADGVHCLVDMSLNKNNHEKLKEIRNKCKSLQNKYRKLYENLKNKQISPLNENDIETLSRAIQEEANKLENPTELEKYFIEALRVDEMQCSVKGAGVFGAFGAGFGHNDYTLKCRSHFGRRPKYLISSTVFGVGVGGAGTGRMTHYEGQGEEIRKKTYPFPYEFFTKKQIHFSFQATGAAGFGLTIQLRNKKFSFGGFGVGFGIFAGAGAGWIKKIKDQEPDYKELFEKLGMIFN